jgi:integrase
MKKSTTRGIYKRGKTWTAHIHWTDPEGIQQQHKRGGFASKAEAEQYLHQYKTEIHTGKRLGTTKLRLEQYLSNEWLPQRESDLKKGTFNSYTRIVNTHLIPHLGRLRLEELTPRIVERFYSQLQKDGARGQRLAPGSGLSAKTVNNIAGVLNRAMRDAVRWGLIATNPIADAHKPKKKSTEMTAWEPDDLGRFISATKSDRQSGTWHLLATTGLRRGEILGLQWEDIDFDKKTLSVRRTRVKIGAAVYYETPKSHAGHRTISLDDRTINALKQQKARQSQEKLAMGGRWVDQNGHIVTEPDGSLVDPHRLTQRFKALLKKHELPAIRFHDVRHSYVVAARRAGVDVKTVSQRIGHADVNVTLTVYDHVFHNDDVQAADNTADLLYNEQS